MKVRELDAEQYMYELGFYRQVSNFMHHYNKAFVEHFGCCPGLYPHAKIPGRAVVKG